MAGLWRFTAAPSLIYQPRNKLHGFRCCSEAPKYRNKDVATPQFLKISVSGVTEILRFFSSNSSRLDIVRDVQSDEISVSCMDDILSVLKSDYEKEYFVSGIFTSGVYVDDCIFEDPTIKFRERNLHEFGAIDLISSCNMVCQLFDNLDFFHLVEQHFQSGKDLYSRNLNLLVPFFDQPSIILQKIEKGNDHERDFVLATWKLRTYLKLPWRPLICIDGRTVYDLNDEYKIIRHAESWNVSAVEAIIQIFTPGTTNE